ncbi:MAG TPA: hypothetical protein VNO50_05435 [Pyrinomonadaceae bacterium]|nr:hypothetical protein [Pyrinomonadaceae bacterium]
METRTNHLRPTKSLDERYAEVSRYFMGEGSLNATLKQLAADLKNHDIDYAVIGAVALFAHGYERFTENINLVLSAEGLEKFRKELLGRGGWGVGGYDQTESATCLRSYPFKTTIEVMTTGEFPGDGKPKPVTIPDPSAASIEIDGVRFVTIEKLIELKLASGMTAPHRLKDLADVQELIKIRDLQAAFAEQLDPYVREKFIELYETIKQSPKDPD